MAVASHCYADAAITKTAAVVELEKLAPSIFRLRMACPEMAQSIRPGQFLMVRLHQVDDPLIGRPFALFDADASAGWVDFVFVVGGKMTGYLSQLSTGTLLDVWGPLGNGFSLAPADDVLLVAGGIGYTPFLAVAKHYAAQTRPGNSATSMTLCFGARTACELVHLEEFERLGVRVRTATEDGSAGHRGRVTELIELPTDASDRVTRVLCCGPVPMMQAVCRLALRRSIACEASLETPMACGIGICFSCVAKIRTPSGEWDYRRTCIEGPVFSATDLVF